MHLHALIVGPTELDTLEREGRLRRLRRSAADLRSEFPAADLVAASLETIRIQLEGSAAGSRFPLLWRLGLALARDSVEGWDASELDPLTQELSVIEQELERLPIGLAATILLDDEGIPGVYSRVSPHLEQAGIYQPPNLATMIGPVITAVRALAIKAMVRGCAVALVREGVRVEYLWSV